MRRSRSTTRRRRSCSGRSRCHGDGRCARDRAFALRLPADALVLRRLLERRPRSADERAALSDPVRRRDRARTGLQLGRAHGRVQPHREGARGARRRDQPRQDGDAGGAVRAACDALDGLADGVVSNRRPAASTPRRCAARLAPTPATPACRTPSSPRWPRGPTRSRSAAAPTATRVGRSPATKTIPGPGPCGDGRAVAPVPVPGHDGQELPGARPGRQFADVRL